MSYIENPKTKGSGIIACIPQTNECPNDCSDCFFNGGRSFLSPLSENLPNIPTPEMAEGRIVRMNDGHDSNIERELVEEVAQRFDDYFFNTSIPDDLGAFSGPVVLTVNPGDMTDADFHKLEVISMNLMFVRVRVNMWNLELVRDVVKYYTEVNTAVVLTFMAYFNQVIPDDYKGFYEYRKRTLNSYWCLKDNWMRWIESIYRGNSLVYSCGSDSVTLCSFCGNCLREFYRTKERLRHGL